MHRMGTPSRHKYWAIRRFRHHLFKRLTGGKSAGRVPQPRHIDDCEAIEHILICRTVCSLGNLVCLTPLLSELESRCPRAGIDLVVRSSAAAGLFRNFANVHTVHRLPRRAFRHPGAYLAGMAALRKRHYDLAINPGRSNTDRLLVKWAKSTFHIDGTGPDGGPCEPAMRHRAKRPVLILRKHLAGNSATGKREFPRPDIRLSEEEKRWGKGVLESMAEANGQPGRDTIALFAYATGDKHYGTAWWRAFHASLAGRFGDFNFIEILPAHGESGLSRTIPTYLGLDIRQVAAVISAAKIFIGADSGIMHLASAAQTLTFGLFSTTDPREWQPYGGFNAGIRTANRSCEAIADEIHSAFTRHLAPISGSGQRNGR